MLQQAYARNQHKKEIITLYKYHVILKMCCVFLQSSIPALIENLNSANGFSIETVGSFSWEYY